MLYNQQLAKLMYLDQTWHHLEEKSRLDNAMEMVTVKMDNVYAIMDSMELIAKYQFQAHALKLMFLDQIEDIL